jgi:hypothetical protein
MTLIWSYPTSGCFSTQVSDAPMTCHPECSEGSSAWIDLQKARSRRSLAALGMTGWGGVVDLGGITVWDAISVRRRMTLGDQMTVPERTLPGESQ